MKELAIYNNSLVLNCFHSFPEEVIWYATIIKKGFNKIINSGRFDLPRILDIALKITVLAIFIVTSTKFELSILLLLFMKF